MSSNQSLNNNDFNGSQMFTDCKNWIKSLFDSLPFFVKWVIILNILFCILNLFTRYISFYLADIPYFTIFYGQIWRLFTTAFITTGLFSLIFGIYIFNKYSNQREKDIGTVKYALYFFRNCFFIQVIYCIIFFIISLIINNFNLLKLKMFGGSIRNEGLWPILILEITLICLENPEREMTFFLIPCPIKAKFYPLALLCIFTLLNNFVIDFELLSAIAFGFLCHYYIKDKIEISNTFALKMENSFLFKWMKNKNGFVSITNPRSNSEIPANLEVINNRNNNMISNSNSINNNNENKAKRFKPFAGKGVTVGATEQKSVENVENEEKAEKKEKEEKVIYSNVNSRTNDTLNSSDSRLDLNTSTNSQV